MGLVDDNFNDGVRGGQWDVFNTQPSEIDGVLDVSNVSTGGDLYKGYGASSLISTSSNFDFQIDFKNLSNTGVGDKFIFLNFTDFSSGYIAIARGLLSGVERYVAQSFNGATWDSGITNSSDSAGKLRVTKVGSVYSSYFYNTLGSTWTLLHSRTISNFPNSKIYLYSYVSANTTIAGKFDNFVANVSGWDYTPMSPIDVIGSKGL